MPRYAYEGKTKVVYVESIEDITAPTTSELNAGTDITNFIRKDGLSTPQNQNMIDSATINDTFDAQVVGSWGGELEIGSFRDDDDDVAWDLFEYGDNAYVVIRRALPSETAWTNGQAVEVYPTQSHQPIPAPSAANEQVGLTVKLAVRAQPALKAVVGGGS